MTLPDLGAWLRRHRDSDASLTLDQTRVRSLQDELQRLRQSNDRMRRQNAKLRKRMARNGEALPEALPEALSEDLSDTPSEPTTEVGGPPVAD